MLQITKIVAIRYIKIIKIANIVGNSLIDNFSFTLLVKDGSTFVN